MTAENPASKPDVDLFGAPITQIRERWGRPGFAKTPENQRLVALLRGRGWNQKRIATYLRCDEKTLRKHFSRELQAGADLIEGQALEVLLHNMRAGGAGSGIAAKRILDVIEAGRAAPPVPKSPADEEKEPAPQGKKEMLADAAKRPGASWGDLLN